MKTLALIAFAGAASTATAQDMLVTVQPDGLGADGWTISAEFLGDAPTPVLMVWADASFNVSGDAPISITSFNPSYSTTLGPAVITGDGTNSASDAQAKTQTTGANRQ